MSIGFFGINPIYDYRQTPDIFGRLLKITRANLVDSFTATAVALMGEGKEQTPFLILRGCTKFTFTSKDTYKQITIPKGEDIYTPLLKNFINPRIRS